MSPERSFFTTEAHAVAEAACAQFKPQNNLTIVNNNPPAWVFVDGKDGYAGSSEPNIAIRITTSQHPEKLLEETKKVVQITEDVRNHGGQVLEVLEEPRLLNGRFVSVISRFLPGKHVTAHDYGQALASMHNASEQANLDSTKLSFDPLSTTQSTFDYIHAQHEMGRPFQIGDTIFGEELLHTLAERLIAQQQAVREVKQIMLETGKKAVLLQEDTHLENVRGNKHGVATLIDLDEASIGAAEYDLGRARTQWPGHFRSPEQYQPNFLKGYRETIAVPSAPNILKRTDSIALLRFGTALISVAVRQVAQGHPANEWLLQEGIRRLNNLDDPSFEWQPLNNAQKTEIAK